MSTGFSGVDLGHLEAHGADEPHILRGKCVLSASMPRGTVGLLAAWRCDGVCEGARPVPENLKFNFLEKMELQLF